MSPLKLFSMLLTVLIVIGNSERTQLQVSFESFCADMEINSEILEEKQQPLMEIL